ncbi:Ger(x)C family spore germination protein [Paenibacillus ginsengarvi]|uniref:Ger(X)C family spore germination protein n=1 Tax=Paenibacillus ginsengarvi TaxID=400777 RepID=A0A3B0CLJ1_9BACL|nr:Ger(x)C family spore germination protein [Paenibacillus ginsengarvi]RKN86082.1 Ger(x)C family spore germination protein [Paenibacillus ginsengarvi]
MSRIMAVLIGCLFVTIVLSGCWNRRELNDLAIVLGIGIDKHKDQYRVSVQIVNPQEIATKKTGGGNSPITIYEETGKTIFECLRRMTTKSPRKIYTSHLRTLIISEEVAREGVKDILDFFARDHEMRTDFYVVIAREAKARDVMSILQPLEKVPANFLFKSLQTSEKAWAPTAGKYLDDLMADLMSKGRAATLTGVRMYGDEKSGESVDNLKTAHSEAYIKYSTIGVFRRDKLVGWLDEEESKGYNFITNKVESTVGVLECPKGGEMSVEVIRSNTKVKGTIKDGQPVIEVSIHIEQNIGEVACEVDLNDIGTISQFEQISKKRVQSFLDKVVDKAQKKYKSDIFGFGEVIQRDEPKAWERLVDDWATIFPHIQVNFKLDIKIRRTGTQSNSFRDKVGR